MKCGVWILAGRPTIHCGRLPILTAGQFLVHAIHIVSCSRSSPLLQAAFVRWMYFNVCQAVARGYIQLEDILGNVFWGVPFCFDTHPPTHTPSLHTVTWWASSHLWLAGGVGPDKADTRLRFVLQTREGERDEGGGGGSCQRGKARRGVWRRGERERERGKTRKAAGELGS